jgi:hypothetical protein
MFAMQRLVFDHILDLLQVQDWVARHENYAWVQHRNPGLASRISQNMSPDVLLTGTRTGKFASDAVIPLPDRARPRQTTLDDFFRNVRARR